MAVKDPVKVKGANIVSVDVPSFGGGLDERGDYNIAPDCISFGRNVMINSANNVTKRLSKKKWLPSVSGFNSEVTTVYYEGEIHYFIADAGKVKHIQENDTAWQDAGGFNDITTDPGVITTFMRVNDWLLCMNGVDELRYIDLATFEMVQFTFVADPTNAITAAATGISTTGGAKVYYAYNYNSNGGGQTAIGPILSQSVSKSRSTWKADGSEFLTLTFNDTPPAGATSRNLFAAIALQGTTPTASDLAMLEANIPTSTTTYVDNGSKGFDIAYNLAPDTNTTRGPKASAGLMAGSIPVIYGDPDNPYDVVFGAINAEGVAFAGEGTQRLPLLKGTNYYPTSVIGFRNNQGIPNLLALFTGTEGTSKQQIVSQKTLSYGNSTITYWGADDLNAGASAVYAKYGVIPYLGELLFPSSDGITSIKTEQSLQNVLQPSIVSDPINDTYRTIKSANFNKIVGAAWNNLVCFAIPSRGYNYNNQIAIRDMTNREKPKWALWDLAVDWIGTISPPNQASFLYVRQGGDFFKLQESYVAEDETAAGLSEPYPMVVEGTLMPFSRGRNSFFAMTQAVLYLADFIGTVDIEIFYTDKKGKTKSKKKTFTNGTAQRNTLAGWGNPRLLYQAFNNRMIGWSKQMATAGESGGTQKVTKRCRIRLPNPVVNEVKFRISSNLENTSFDLVNANYEGVNIGIIGDIV